MSADIDTFLEDFRKNGGFLDERLQFLQAPGFEGVSLFSASPNVIPSDSVLLSCPESFVITPDFARSELDSLDLDDHAAVCLYLCRPSPQHRSYVRSLPSLGSILTPLHWTEQELEFLIGTNLYNASIMRLNTWKAEYDAVDEDLTENISWEQYLHAATIMSSRSFPSSLLPSYKSKDGNSTAIMVPMLDFLNHKRAQPVTWYHTDSELQFLNRADIQAHEQVFNNYGPKPNDELLLGYGFVSEDNPEEVLSISLKPLLRSATYRKLVSLGVNPDNYYYLKRRDGLPKDLLQALRIIFASPTELKISEDLPVEMVSTASEKLGLEGLRDGILLQIMSVIEEKSFLQSIHVRQKVQNMLSIYFKGQKEIMDICLKDSNEKLMMLETSQ